MADRRRRCAGSGSPQGPICQWLPFSKKILDTFCPATPLGHKAAPVCRNMLQHMSSSAKGGRPVLSTRNLSDPPRERALLSPRLGWLAHARDRAGMHARRFDPSGVFSPPAGGPATPLPRVPHCGRLCAAPEIASCCASPRRRTSCVFRPSSRPVTPAPPPTHVGICAAQRADAQVRPCAVRRSVCVCRSRVPVRSASADRGPMPPGPST